MVEKEECILFFNLSSKDSFHNHCRGECLVAYEISLNYLDIESLFSI